jgi:hypothetical protein
MEESFLGWWYEFRKVFFDGLVGVRWEFVVLRYLGAA